MAALLSVEKLAFAYGARRAVDGLSLELHEGEILGLLGPNGAGKSTLIALVTGLLEPLEGRVRVAGGDPRLPAARAALGLAPQELALYEDLSARENLHFFGRVQGLKGARLKERAERVLEETGLAGRAGERVAAFSGGMKRRLNLAAALLHEPDLLLLDEPTAGVDPQSRNALYEMAQAQRAAGRGVLYATHYMEEAQRLCDRVAILDQGRLLDLDTVPALLARHGGPARLEFTRGGEAHSLETREPLADLARLHAEGPLEGFLLRQPDLEQAFLHLTGRRLRD
jgi:ABC-2 type transport system ATP-binding protein